ncbi:MAG: transporter substrate-binding domain-containing protein, partial [Alphaproteobacteria bacterium]
MTQVMGVRAPRWISSLVVCGLAGVALHISGTTSARAAMAQDRAASAPELREIIAAVPRSWPPQYSVDENGKPVGFAIDVMEEIAALAGLHVTYLVAENFPAAVDMVQRGDAELIPNSGILPERMADSAFTAPVETFTVSLFVRNDTHDLKGVADLVGRKLAVVEKNIGQFMFGERRDIDVHVYRDVRTALFELIAGQVDALVYPQPVILTLARQVTIEDRIKVVGEPVAEVRRGIRVKKGSVELLAVLDKAVERFVGTPEYRRIYVKWYGKPAPFWTVRRVASTMGGVIAVLFLLMVWWRYRVSVRMIQVSHEKRLRGAIESLQEGFLLFDADDRLVMINSPYQEIHPQAQEFLDKGLRFEDVIRANVAAGRMVEALGREEEFIRERLEQHRNPGPPILRQYNDGMWYIIKETRTP